MSDERAFKTSLQQQLENIQKLTAILSAEKNVLQQHSPSALTNISQEKSDLLTEIDALDKQCKALPNYETHLISSKYSALLLSIKEALQACQKLNTVNGMIIEHSSLAIERMQNKLLESRSGSSITYTNKGKKRGGTLGKSIKA